MRYLLVLLVFATVILPGIGHGLMTDRWYASNDLEVFNARLAKVPMDLQDWHGEDLKVDPQQFLQTEITGFVARQYTHRPSQRRVSVLICCGRGGPVSVHTPEICYVGAGYRMTSETAKTTLNNSNRELGEVYGTTFGKSQPVPEFLQVYWSWNSKGAWEAPATPRLTYAGHRALYKLYVVCPFASESQRQEAQEACKSFFDVLIPELKRSLF